MRRGVFLQILGVLVLVAAAGAGWYFLAGPGSGPGAPGGPGGPGARGPGGMPPSPVMVREARTDRVSEQVQAVGTVRARESVEIVAEVAGRMVAVHFDEGSVVRKGDVLVEIDDARERAELREAVAQRDDISKQLERARELRRSQHVSAARIDELEAALEAREARVELIRARLSERRILAPYTGMVGLREISPGAFIAVGQRITTLDDIEVVYVQFSLPERFFGQLRPGLAVRARTPAFGDRRFDGKINRIDSRVDTATRSVRVQAEFDNPAGHLRPGMFMSVDVVLAERDAVIVPEEAIVSQRETHAVFVVVDGKAVRREVELGVRREGEVEILKGVNAGETVISEGATRVRDGAPVRVLSPDGGASGGGPPDGGRPGGPPADGPSGERPEGGAPPGKGEEGGGNRKPGTR